MYKSLQNYLKEHAVSNPHHIFNDAFSNITFLECDK